MRNMQPGLASMRAMGGTWAMTGSALDEAAKLDTFPKYLLFNAKRFADRPAMRHKDLGIWQTWTWSEQLEEIRAFALGLDSLVDIRHGDRIAIIGANRPRLYWTFAAVQSLGAIPVPVYADAVGEELAFVLDNAGVVIAVVQDQEQVDKIQQFRERIPQLKHVIYDEPRGLRDYDHENLHSFISIQDSGSARLKANPGLADEWKKRIQNASGDDMSVMLYTSGTTGQSKGVMIRSASAIKAAEDTVAFDGLTERDEVLAYLPLAWVGDHYLNYAQGYVAGFCMSCPESPETVPQDLREIGPTFYFAPPRVFEGLLTSVTIRIEDASRIKKRLFEYFRGVARKYGEAILEKRPVPLSGRILYWLGDLLVYGPLKNVLGFSNIRIAYTAGEAIGPDLFSFFRSLGINLKQLYGQTEAFLYVTCQESNQVRADTVGPPAPNVEIKISDDGEVLFKSPGMFAGYYGQEAKTAETLTEDGFVKTGDAGFFEKDGQLKIIDRAKDVGKLNTGALFAPKYIENTLKFFPNIKEAVAFGRGRDYAAAFINIDLQAVGNWAERNNISYASYQELAGHPLVYDMIADNVDETNRKLASEPMVAGSQIKRFLVLHKELDADDGELTRTQKVRRAYVEERYAELIEALYDGSTEKYVETEVTFEDGRRGKIRATVKIRDARTYGDIEPIETREAAE